MKALGYALVTIAALAALAAIWLPGQWWQWLLTGVVALFVGAAILGNQDHK